MVCMWISPVMGENVYVESLLLGKQVKGKTGGNEAYTSHSPRAPLTLPTPVTQSPMNTFFSLLFLLPGLPAGVS